jgi:hypothetical protein
MHRHTNLKSHHHIHNPLPMLSAYPAHLIILDLFTQKVLGEVYWVLILTLLFGILKYGFRSPVRRPWNPRQDVLPLRNTIVASGSIWRETRKRISRLPFVDDSRLNNGTVTLQCAINRLICSTGQLKCNGTRAETIFHLSAKRTSPFKSTGASVQSTTGSWCVQISFYCW